MVFSDFWQGRMSETCLFVADRSFRVFSSVIRLAEVEIEHASAPWPVTKFMIWHPTFSG